MTLHSKLVDAAALLRKTIEGPHLLYDWLREAESLVGEVTSSLPPDGTYFHDMPRFEAGRVSNLFGLILTDQGSAGPQRSERLKDRIAAMQAAGVYNNVQLVMSDADLKSDVVRYALDRNLTVFADSANQFHPLHDPKNDYTGFTAWAYEFYKQGAAAFVLDDCHRYKPVEVKEMVYDIRRATHQAVPVLASFGAKFDMAPYAGFVDAVQVQTYRHKESTGLVSGYLEEKWGAPKAKLINNLECFRTAGKPAILTTVDELLTMFRLSEAAGVAGYSIYGWDDNTDFSKLPNLWAALKLCGLLYWERARKGA